MHLDASLKTSQKVILYQTLHFETSKKITFALIGHGFTVFCFTIFCRCMFSGTVSGKPVYISRWQYFTTAILSPFMPTLCVSIFAVWRTILWLYSPFACGRYIWISKWLPTFWHTDIQFSKGTSPRMKTISLRHFSLHITAIVIVLQFYNRHPILKRFETENENYILRHSIFNIITVVGTGVSI